ncbi:hypothetical protein H310_08205 [Aphanomyces invadans]|uniref:Uncharacterized protein n=1 Tax=Aphanomyces invadans TaxID=157072 RepID=A0A024U1R6_9STRA|nr:hypothetical protein H310_08205 [Aphanomyces invadans]ETV99542.1 hypothetical protein H310_08205 [Aphanomyces invadans]|eukprot:XP_008872098.1 hypothetical protein H310_08205 [Aphanomyces invadans]
MTDPRSAVLGVLLHAPLLSMVLQFQHGLTFDLRQRYDECRAMTLLLNWDSECLYPLPSRYARAAEAHDLLRKLPDTILSPRTNMDLATLVASSDLCLHADSPMSHRAFHLAILEGDLRIVQKWIDFYGTPQSYAMVTPAALDFCARLGAQDLLHFLLSTTPQRCTTRGVDAACKHGHLSILTVLHRHKLAPWSTGAMDGAALHGHIDIVTFLHTHGAPCTTLAMSGAASRGHLNIVRFLHENRSEGCTKWAMDAAAKHGHFDVVKFLHTKRREGCTDAALTAAAGGGHLRVVRYLWENRPMDCFVRAAHEAAVAQGHVHVAAYLQRQCPV